MSLFFTAYVQNLILGSMIFSLNDIILYYYSNIMPLSLIFSLFLLGGFYSKD